MPVEASRTPGWKVGVAVMSVIMTGFAAWALRGILTPLVLAVFLLLMIDGLARALTRRIPGFPQRLALPAALILVVVFFALTTWVVADNVGQLVAQSDSYGLRLNALDRRGLRTRLGLRVPPTIGDLLQRLNPSRFAGAAASVLQNVASDGAFVLIYLGFLIASRQGFAKKSARMFATGDGSREAAGNLRAGSATASRATSGSRRSPD